MEEFIVFAAAIAAVALLRHQRDEPRSPRTRTTLLRPRTSPALRVLGAALAGPTVVIALDLVAHGAAHARRRLPGRRRARRDAPSSWSRRARASGCRPTSRRCWGRSCTARARPGSSCWASAGWSFSGAFLSTTFAGHGTTGALLSGGAIPLLNVATGFEVAGALIVILAEFLEQEMLATEEDAG